MPATVVARPIALEPAREREVARSNPYSSDRGVSQLGSIGSPHIAWIRVQGTTTHSTSPSCGAHAE